MDHPTLYGIVSFFVSNLMIDIEKRQLHTRLVRYVRAMHAPRCRRSASRYLPRLHHNCAPVSLDDRVTLCIVYHPVTTKVINLFNLYIYTLQIICK